MAEESLLDEVSESMAIARHQSKWFSILGRAAMLLVVFFAMEIGLTLNSVAHPWIFGIAACTVMMWMRGK